MFSRFYILSLEFFDELSKMGIMSTPTPKQLQIQNRELKILEIAREHVVSEGYHGLNMDRIAEEIKSSKGTVYNHFGCKEEIIIALAVQTMEKRAVLFQDAAQFKRRISSADSRSRAREQLFFSKISGSLSL